MKRIALTVGIGTAYKALSSDCYKELSDLKTSRFESVVEKLIKSGWEIIELREEEATKEEVLNQLKSISAALNKDDQCLFYFSGHGGRLTANEDGSIKEFLVTYYERMNSEPTSTSLIKNHFLTDEEYSLTMHDLFLEKEVSFISVLDCCNSGGIMNKTDHSNHILFAASKETERTFAIAEGASLFSRALAEIWNKPDTYYGLQTSLEARLVQLYENTDKNVDPVIIIPEKFYDLPPFTKNLNT